MSLTTDLLVRIVEPLQVPERRRLRWHAPPEEARPRCRWDFRHPYTACDEGSSSECGAPARRRTEKPRRQERASEGDYGWSGIAYRVGRDLTGLQKPCYDAAIMFGDVL